MNINRSNLNKRRFSLLTVLLFRIFVVLFIVLIASSLLINHFVKFKLKNQINNQTLFSFQETENKLSNFFVIANQTINTIFTFTNFSELIEIDNPIDKTKFLIQLREDLHKANIQNFDCITITDNENVAVILTKQEYLVFQNNFVEVQPQFHYSPFLNSRFYYDIKDFDKYLSRDVKDRKFVTINKSFIAEWSDENNRYLTRNISIGISDKNLNNFFGHMQNSKNHIFIVDKDGLIISGDSPEHPEGKLSYFDKLSKGQQIFDVKLNNIEHHVVTYDLSNFGWKIISETPSSSYLHDIYQISTTLKIIFIIEIIVIFLISFFQFASILKPLYELENVMNIVSNGELGTRFSSYTRIKEIINLGNQFNEMTENFQFHLSKEKKLIEEQNNLKMQTLMAQMNPHFIHNTLNIIKWMAQINGSENICNATQSLIQITSSCFKEKNLVWKISEEYVYLKEYLNILEIRYGLDAQFNLDIDESIFSKSIPRLIIQPLIENAVFHGYSPNNSFKVDIIINQSSPKNILITVKDNGIGIQDNVVNKLNNHEEITHKNSMGIKNVIERLDLFYGKNYSFNIHKKYGVKVVISCPIDFHNGR